MAVARLLTLQLTDKEIGRQVVPILPDEAHILDGEAVPLPLIKMWLDAPVEGNDGKGGKKRTTPTKDSGRGVPQGSPISPLMERFGSLRQCARAAPTVPR